MALREVDVKELDLNPFTSIGDEWMLITAGDEQSHNTMTASWGALGVMWGKSYATCYIRQSRYTKRFVDSNELFTLSFYDTAQCRKALVHLGAVSGRDEDKIAAVGFTPVAVDGTTTFAEAKLTLVCRKRSETFIAPEGFIDPEVDSTWYGDKDYHTMYIASIEHAYVAEWRRLGLGEAPCRAKPGAVHGAQPSARLAWRFSHTKPLRQASAHGRTIRAPLFVSSCVVGFETLKILQFRNRQGVCHVPGL